MAARVTGDTSDDTHLADDSKRRENAASSSGYAPPVQEEWPMTADTSVDAHHAGHAFPDTVLALMSYNIGIQNKEVHSGRNWTQKYKRIRDDVESVFTNKAGIQVLLISEFGNMFDDIDGVLSSGVAQPTGRKVRSTRELFEDLLASIKLPHIRVVADPPYVALIDSECWRVEHHEVLKNLCTKHDIKVQHLILKHVNTLETFRCFNAHMPSTYATLKRKEDCVKTMCQVATDSAVGQRTACMPWILAGDLNVDLGTMSRWCQAFVEKDVPCFSKSEWPQERDAQKADFALSQGIALVSCKSWLGVHSPPCASDAHDAVVVTFTVAIPSYCPKECIVTRSESRWVRQLDGQQMTSAATVHLQWRFHPTIPRSALSPEVSHDG